MNTKTQKHCVVIGDPVDHSLSPKMHKAGYKALGLSDDFIYSKKRVGQDEIKSILDGFRADQTHGISVTFPLKRAVIPYLDEVTPEALKIDAVNTIVNHEGRLVGYNTDWYGVVGAIKNISDLKGLEVSLLGAGATARAAAYGLQREGAKVCVYNRTIKKAECLAKDFDFRFSKLSDTAAVKKSDLVLNTTSFNTGEGSIISKDALVSGQIVFDVNYKPLKTELLQNAETRGATIIYGTEMLLYQGVMQFELYTGKKAPVEAMREVLND